MRIYENYYDIIVLPPKKVQDKLIALSEKLTGGKGLWQLGEREYIPHLSLYHIPVKPTDFEQLAQKTRDVISRVSFGEIRCQKAEKFDPHNSVFITTNNPDWLVKLHQEIIQKTLPLFDWSYDVKGIWHAEQFPDEARANFDRYGTPMAGSYFQPHFTLTIFPDRNTMTERYSTFSFEPFAFQADEVAIGQLGDHIQIASVIKRYPKKQ